MDVKPILSVENLSVKRGKRTVLQDISFDLFDSTGVVGLFGPNGAENQRINSFVSRVLF